MEAAAITLYPLLWYFILYAFVGWCLEVVFCSVNTGSWVNRGFLNGPLCPIYGFGALLVILLLQPVAENPLLLYAGSVVLTSLLELVGGFLLEKLFHTRWWDYTSEPFNLGGYICLKFSLAWGVACVVLIRVIHPALAAGVALLPVVLGWVLLALLYAALLADLVVTVLAIRKTNAELRELADIQRRLRAESERMAEKLGGTALKAADRLETLHARQEESKEALQQRYKQLMEGKNRRQRRMFRAFPNMRSLQNPELLEEMKEKMKARLRRGSK